MVEGRTVSFGYERIFVLGDDQKFFILTFAAHGENTRVGADKPRAVEMKIS